jgi:hypothetical protein
MHAIPSTPKPLSAASCKEGTMQQFRKLTGPAEAPSHYKLIVLGLNGEPRGFVTGPGDDQITFDCCCKLAEVIHTNK